MGAATMDLMDELDAILPRVNPVEEVREILAVMAKISRAATATLLVERDGTLLWLAGDPISRDSATTIRSAWRAQRLRLLTGTAFSEGPGPVRRPMRTWLMWIRRPGNAGLDAIYFAGANLRPLTACAEPLARLAALLVRVPGLGQAR